MAELESTHDPIYDEILKDNEKAVMVNGATGEPVAKVEDEPEEEQEEVEDQEEEKEESKEESEQEEKEESEEDKEEDEEKDESDDFLKRVNETLGVEFKDISEFESLKEDVSKLPEYKDAVKLKTVVDDLEAKRKELEEQNKALRDMYDPMKVFANETEYKRNQLIKKFPEYDPDVVGRIVKKDIDKLDAIESIKLKELLENPDIYTNDKQALDIIYDQLGIDEDTTIEEIEGLQRTKLLKSAKEAKKLFQSLKDGVDDMSTIDVLADREAQKKEVEENHRKLKDEWKPFMENLADVVDDIDHKGKDETGAEYDFTFKLGEDFRNDLKKEAELAANYYAKRNLKFDDEGKQRVKAELLDFYIKKNWRNIMEVYAADRVARYVESNRKEKANPPDVNKKTDVGDAKKTKQQKIKERAEADLLADLG